MAIKAHNSSWLLIFEEIFFFFLGETYCLTLKRVENQLKKKSAPHSIYASWLHLLLWFWCCKLSRAAQIPLPDKTKKTCKQRWLCTFVPPLSRYLVSYAYYDIQITSEVEMLEAVSKTKSRSSNSNPKQPISHAARAKPVALYWKLSREPRLSNIYQIYYALQKCWKKCNFFGRVNFVFFTTSNILTSVVIWIS